MYGNRYSEENHLENPKKKKKKRERMHDTAVKGLKQINRLFHAVLLFPQESERSRVRQ